MNEWKQKYHIYCQQNGKYFPKVYRYVSKTDEKTAVYAAENPENGVCYCSKTL